jgi:hypothetical protein
MNKYLKNWLFVRIIFGLIVVLVEIGSVLEGDWGTALVAMIFALFLTVSPVTLKEKLKLRYGLAFAVVLAVFGVSSNQTMNSFDQNNQAEVSQPKQ